MTDPSPDREDAPGPADDGDGGRSGPRHPRRPAIAKGPPAFNAPPITLWLVGIISAVFALLQVAPSGWRETILVNLALIPDLLVWTLDTDPFSLTALLRLASLVTHALIHLDLLHWMVNVGFLLAFGSLVERVYGRRRYILLLVVSVLAGALAQMAFAGWQSMIMLGASAGVAGCFAAAIRLMVIDPDPARQRLGWTMLAVLAVFNVIFGLAGGALLGVEGGIAWVAHIGGFVAGLAIAWRLPRPRWR